MPNLAVEETVRRLRNAGFAELNEADVWKAEAGGEYFVVRGGSVLAARIGTSSIEERGAHVIGAHTDSPNLRIKAVPEKTLKGVTTLGVDTYGGVLWHTWLDRDLGFAGNIWVEGTAGPTKLDLLLRKNLLRVPALAIHLNRGVNKEGLKLNPQRHLPPLVSLQSGDEVFDFRKYLVDAAELDVNPKKISGWDLGLFEVGGGALSGLSSEFLHAPRLDNLGSCHAALRAFLEVKAQRRTQMIAFYDHEECGSESVAGAQSDFLASTIRRLVLSTTKGQSFENFRRAMSQSFVLSVDMAHALHPNFPTQHDANHAPKLGGGPVIKINVNQRYATDGEGRARVKHWGHAANVDIQEYVHRTDLACGTTIGPITASRLGVKTADIGNPMLSMHSAREMMATGDQRKMIDLMASFLADEA